MVKNPPETWETWVRSLGWEDPLEKGMAIHPSILPGVFHGQRSLVATAHGVQKSQTWPSNFHFHWHYLSQKNGSLTLSVAGNDICDSIKSFLFPSLLPLTGRWTTLWNAFAKQAVGSPSLFSISNMSSPIISLLQILCKRNMLSSFYSCYY